MRTPLYIGSIMTLAGLCFISPACYAGDPAQGQTLHNEDCLVCHDSSVYTRENRRVQTLEDLMTRVNLCQEDVGAEWNEIQLDDVVAYLNELFYNFTNAPPAAQQVDALPLE